jgi:hypothetical protein
MVDVNENPRAQNEPLRDTPQDHIARGGCIARSQFAKTFGRTLLKIPDWIERKLRRDG